MARGHTREPMRVAGHRLSEELLGCLKAASGASGHPPAAGTAPESWWLLQERGLTDERGRATEEGLRVLEVYEAEPHA